MSEPRLSALLSWALVAFTIEVDNDLEASMPHFTTEGMKAGAPGGGPWLASLPMWYSCLQFVPPEGIALNELERRTFGGCRLRGSNSGMVRWGYVTVDRDRIVRPTVAGARASALWGALPSHVEGRWAERYGAAAIAALRGALESFVDARDLALPDYVPENAAHGGRLVLETRPRHPSIIESGDLPALMSKALMCLTLDDENLAELSLSYAANSVRVLGSASVPVRDLPRLTGVGKETIAVMARWLEAHGFVTIEGAGSSKVASLTAKGRAAHDRHASADGTDDATLRAALEPIVGELDLGRSPLAAAILPPPSGWRATVPAPETLPHHPVVSHRGGYPDGS